jgi:prolyl oligopeptidase
LGTDPKSDPILMKRGLVAGVEYDKIQTPTILTSPGSRYAILQLADVRPEGRWFIAPLADTMTGKAKWVSFAGFDDEVTDLELDGNDLYLLVNKGSPRGRIVKTSAAAPGIASGTVVVPQHATLVIEDTSRARDGIYLKIMDGGISRLQRLGQDGKVADIALPFDGTIGTVFTVPTEDGALLSFQGWLNPAGIWSLDISGHLADTGITPKPAIDVSAYEAKRFFATAKDGVKIPYTLIYRKGLKQDGSNPTWISAYGSYGLAAYTPAFAGRTLALVDAGAIVGYADVRGGGEYGREWHKAGQLGNKPNTWRDLIAVCEELIAKKYTSSKHLAIGGRSAGGITVGRAMTERPDLFAAVIDGVGWSNPLRYVVEQNGYGEEPEWGAIRLQGAQDDRQLSVGERWHRVSRRAAHHRRHRSACRTVSLGKNDRATASRHHVRKTHLAARRLRRRPRHRLNPRAAGPRSGRHLCLLIVAASRQRLNAERFATRAFGPRLG